MSSTSNSINSTIGASVNNTIAQHIRAAAGQWDNFDDQTDVHGYYSGVGSPEGVVAADIGSIYSDTGAGATGVYYKTTDTANTGWQLLSVGSSVISTQIFTTGSGTYTPTPGALFVWVRALAGGGGGGGSTSIVATQGVGGGGGAGGYAEYWEAATSRAYSIGSGGAGGTAGNTGSTGSNTTFGTAGAQILVAGGLGGVSDNSAAFGVAFGGAGGAATNGTLLIAGSTGYTATGAQGAIMGGLGANSPLGSGGVGACIVTTTSLNGSAGSGFGSGGGGGSCAGPAGSATGGAGANGVIIITEYA